jgi:hypothetical protein
MGEFIDLAFGRRFLSRGGLFSRVDCQMSPDKPELRHEK